MFKKRYFLLIGFIGFFLLWPITGASKKSNKKSDLLSKMNECKKRIILLGASVGRNWNISSFPDRINNSNYIFEYRHGGSAFDKSIELKDILSRSENRPNAIFLKECAAYFPNDLEHYKRLMMHWVSECRKVNIVPIPTTVVPVTRLHAFKKWLIDIVKGRNPFKNGNPFKHRRNKSILEYNEWIRKYCKEQGLAVLDLEAAVIYSEENRFLKENLARIDGLHLNTKAYEKLDYIILPVLNAVSWGR